MHNPGTVSGNSQNGLTHEQEIQAAYTEDFMNLDDNIFSLDAESRELIFGMSLGVFFLGQTLTVTIGRTGMGDTNHSNNQPYGSNSMQTDSNELNTILAQMPTPVSNDIRASETNTFMSPLQVDQQSYDRMNGVQFSTHGNGEVYISFPIIADTL